MQDINAIADQIEQDICNAFGAVCVEVTWQRVFGWSAFFATPGTGRVCGMGETPEAVLSSARIAVCAARSAESRIGPGCVRMRPGQIDDSGYSSGRLLA